MPKILGVNLDSGSLQVSLLETKFRSGKHIKSERTVLPESREERSRLIAELLTRWQKEQMPAGVVIGLPLQNFSWRTIEMPAMKRADLKKALFFELEKYLPLPVDEYIYDFFVIGRVKTAPKAVRIMVFTVKKDLLSGMLRIVKDAGLEILSVRCSTIDTLCGVIDISGEKGLHGVFVNAADDAYEVASLRDSMPVSLKRISKADPDGLNVELETLAAGHPAQLYVCGPVEQSIITKYNSKKFQLLTADLIASSHVKKPCLNLDFLPAEFIKQKKDYYPYIIGGLAVAALLVFFLNGAVVYYKDRSAVKNTESKIASVRSRASGVIEAEKKLDILRNERGALLDFQNRSNIAVKVLGTLSKTLPADTWLISFSVDDKGQVEMEGFAARAADLVVTLEKSRVFRNISFSAPIISKGNEERFAIRMEVGEFEKK